MVFSDLNNFQDKLNKAHPKQIISKIGKFRVTLFEVDYNYTTNRNNKKSGRKYFLIDTSNPQYDIKKEFYQWVDDYNTDNIHRQISNVKFLEGKCIGYIHI